MALFVPRCSPRLREELAAFLRVARGAEGCFFFDDIDDLHAVEHAFDLGADVGEVGGAEVVLLGALGVSFRFRYWSCRMTQEAMVRAAWIVRVRAASPEVRSSPMPSSSMTRRWLNACVDAVSGGRREV